MRIISGSLANQLHMLPHPVQKLTAYLALTLVGLVGGLGTGLHTVFNCCHHCDVACAGSCCRTAPATELTARSDCCDCGFCNAKAGQSTSASEFSAGDEPREHKDAYLAKSDDDCAICQLLSHFHSTAASYSGQVVVRANRGTVSLLVPSAVVASSTRLEPSRGPPASLFPIVAAVIRG